MAQTGRFDEKDWQGGSRSLVFVIDTVLVLMSSATGGTLVAGNGIVLHHAAVNRASQAIKLTLERS